MVSKLKITSKTYVCGQSLATYTSDTLTSQITATGFVFYLVPLPLLSVTNLPLLFQRLQLYVKILSVMTPAAYDPSVPPKSLVVCFCFFFITLSLFLCLNWLKWLPILSSLCVSLDIIPTHLFKKTQSGLGCYPLLMSFSLPSSNMW